MGQIVKRKKKGRPPKSDLADRDLPDAERDVRRSLRRRSVKYVFDLDDYFDEDEVFADDEDQRRREKKLKFLLKLQNGKQQSTAERDRRVRHAPEASESSSDDGGKPSKKRRIDEEMDEDVDEENDYANEEENYNYEDEEEVRETKRDLKEDSPPGTPTECALPLPDKKTLEIILDKLQRKDIYGVYAEPVDPGELPDYHDVIENPMDFATVRNNLRNGLYATFDQFESDVFLICSNAMQYNAPDTIYYKQARSIQELAKRKFQKLRLNIERNDKLIKSEQKTRSGSLSKKQIKRPFSRTVQEPVGSDFSSGATLATAGDIQNVASALQAVGSEKTVAMDGLVEGSSFLNDNNLDKADESFMGRGTPSRFGRRSSLIQDENRRATYNISLSQPVASSECIFTTFDSEAKELMPVGLYADHSYARSLARFAATLGSVAWKVASKRIEQALPQGIKFGQGWVGEFEPLPTPVLMLKNCTVKEPPFLTKVQPVTEPRNFEKVPVVLNTSKESPGNAPFFQQQKLPFLGPAGIRGSMPETKPSFFLSPGIRPSGPHNPIYTNSFDTDKKAQKQVESNSPRTLNKSAADSAGNRPFSRSSEVEASRSMEYSSKNINFSQSGSFKQPDHSNGVASGGLPNGKVVTNKIPISSPDLTKPSSYEQNQGLSDPVQLMRMLADHHNQQKTNHRSSADPPQVLTSATSPSSNDPNNAAMAAARAWMSVGAGGLRPVTENAVPNKNHLYNPSRSNQPQAPQIRGEFPSSGMYIRPEKNSGPIHAFVPQGSLPMLAGNQMQFQNPRSVFPPFAPPHLSPFQLHASWRNANPQMHSRQKQETLPPDLNIGFQSSGSPGRPSSGVLVDSQQPDLALQL